MEKSQNPVSLFAGRCKHEVILQNGQKLDFFAIRDAEVIGCEMHMQEVDMGVALIELGNPCTVQIKHFFNSEEGEWSGPFLFSGKRSLPSILDTVAKFVEHILNSHVKELKESEREIQPSEKKGVYRTDMDQLIAEAKQSIAEGQKLINDGQALIDKAKAMLSEKIETIESVMNLLGQVHQEMQTLYYS